MSIVATGIQNRVFSEGVFLMLSQTGNLKPVCLKAKTNEDMVIECKAVGADILLMDVTPTPPNMTFEGRMQLIEELHKTVPKCKIALLCDEVAYPELARKVMYAKQERKIDAFFYASVTAEYLIASLNAI